MSTTHRKGSRWRHEVGAWLEEAGFVTTVRGIGFAGDDILAERRFLTLSVEAKNHRATELASWVDQAVDNAQDYPDAPAIPVVIAHRRSRASVDDAYVVMPGWALIELISSLDGAPSPSP